MRPQRTERILTFIPTRCRDLRLKQFCLEDIVPAVLIILIAHIILAVRWMLIKILSAVINGQRSHKVIVPGGCYLDVNIIRKIDRKIKISAESFRQLTLHIPYTTIPATAEMTINKIGESFFLAKCL